MKTEISNLAARLGDALLARGWRVTAAESCTGGGVAQAITAIAGSSQWFDMGFVTYADRAKRELLGVDTAVLASDGAVSEVVVRQMARGALDRATADLAVAISGIAGPDGGSAEKPVGTVWLAWADQQGVRTECRHFNGDRESVRQQAVIEALAGLLKHAAKKHCINQ